MPRSLQPEGRHKAFSMTEPVRGYLVLNVIEATGRNKEETFTWDSDDFTAFVKGAVGQIRTPSRPVSDAGRPRGARG